MSDCSICLEKVSEPFQLECGHTFHNNCITYWLLEKSSCPECRKCIVSVEKPREEEDIYIMIDFDEDPRVPKHTLKSIMYDSQYEIDEFIESNADWTLLKPNQYGLALITKRNSKGTYKIQEECKFSIKIELYKNTYYARITIDSYKTFRKRKLNQENSRFKYKNLVKFSHRY